MHKNMKNLVSGFLPSKAIDTKPRLLSRRNCLGTAPLEIKETDSGGRAPGEGTRWPGRSLCWWDASKKPLFLLQANKSHICLFKTARENFNTIVFTLLIKHCSGELNYSKIVFMLHSGLCSQCSLSLTDVFKKPP